MKRHAIAIIIQNIVSRGISYGLDSCMLDLEDDIESQLKNIATQKATEWWNYDKDIAVLYARAMDISDTGSSLPDYVIYVFDFPDWILDNRFVPEQAKDWFDGHARLALCNQLTNNLTHAATWVDDNIDAWPYFPKDKIICTCHPSISRKEIQAEINNFPQGLYGSCIHVGVDNWQYLLVTIVSIDNERIVYTDGTTEQVLCYDNGNEDWHFCKDFVAKVMAKE